MDPSSCDVEESVIFEDWSATHVEIAERLRPVFAAHGAVFYKRKEPRRVAIGWPGELAPSVLGTMTSQQDGVLLTLRVGRSSGLIGEPGPFASDPHEDSGRLKLESVALVPISIEAYVAKAVSFMGQQRGTA
jgi:hypothetical protein